MSSKPLNFRLNINPCGAPTASLEAAAAALRDIHLYPPADAEPLRTAVAVWHDVSAESIVFGCGVDELIKLAVHVWTRPGDEAVIHVPTFPLYEIELRSHGVRTVAVEGPDPWHIDVERLADALSVHGAAAAFLCLPNNPTAATITEAELARLAEANPETQFVVDEAMIYPLERGMLEVVEHHRNVVVLRTFSKYFGLAGLRVGYAIGAAERLAVMEATRPPFNVSQAAIAAAIAALPEVGFLERCKRFFAQEVEAFESRLLDVDACQVMSALANVVVVKIEGIRAESVIGALGARGLLVRDAREYRGLEGAECIRISLLDSKANARLAENLREICELDGGLSTPAASPESRNEGRKVS